VPIRRWLAATLTLALITPLLAQDAKPVKLEWKFEKDKTFYQTITTDTTLALKTTGADVNQKHKETYVVGWTPVKQEEKNWVLKLRIEGIHVEGDFAGTKVAFDSTRDDNAPGPVSGCLKALVGTEFTLTLSPEMKVTKVEGGSTTLKDFVKKLSAADSQTEMLLSQFVTEDALKAMAEQTFAVLPSKEVKKGDKWDRTAIVPLGPLGTYETKYTYTDDGPDEKNANLEKIGFKADMTYKAPADKLGGGAFKINTADLKSSDAAGTTLFRKDKGRIEKMELKLPLKGKMNIDLGGASDVDVTQTQTITIATSDENPIAKK
jgi:hypothetical protein